MAFCGRHFATLSRLFAISDDIGQGDGDFIHPRKLSCLCARAFSRQHPTDI